MQLLSFAPNDQSSRGQRRRAAAAEPFPRSGYVSSGDHAASADSNKADSDSDADTSKADSDSDADTSKADSDAAETRARARASARACADNSDSAETQAGAGARAKDYNASHRTNDSGDESDDAGSHAYARSDTDSAHA
jgi:hypothetical protein